MMIAPLNVTEPKHRPAIRAGWVILNSYGSVWSHKVWDTEEGAQEELAALFKNPDIRAEFKIVRGYAAAWVEE